jgi:hypothetical protein
MKEESPDSAVKLGPPITVENWTHLAHGLRSQLLPDGTFRINPLGDKFGLQYSDFTPEKFADFVVSAKLLIVGIETLDVTTGDRLEWIPAASLESAFSHGQPPERVWGQVRFRAEKQKNEPAANLAEAVRFHHLASDIALRRVSESYFSLQRHAHQAKTPIGNKFTNVDIFELYNDLHSFFVNLGSLRDYLAGFVSEFILHLGPCDRHSALLKKLKNNSHALSGIVQQFSNKSKKPIGLAGIGEYRDIVVHRSPIGHLNEWVETEQLGPPLEKYGGITLRLPGNPFDLAGEQVDAIVIAHHALAVMCEYSQEIAKHSPIKPLMPHFTEKDGKMVEILPDDLA